MGVSMPNHRLGDVGDGRTAFAKNSDVDGTYAVDRTANPRCVRSVDGGKTEGGDMLLAGTKARNINISVGIEDITALDAGVGRSACEDIASIDGGDDFEALCSGIVDFDGVGRAVATDHVDLTAMEEVRQARSVAVKLDADGAIGHLAAAACDARRGTSPMRPRQNKSADKKGNS
jgi:hypothetical protein